MCGSCLLVVGFLCQVQISESPPGLIDLIRASHETNLARVARGQGVFHVVLEAEGGENRAEMLVNQKWLDRDTEISVKLHDPKGLLLADPVGLPIEQQTEPTYVILYAKRKCFTFAPSLKIVRVVDRNETVDATQPANLIPRHAWFRHPCPRFGSGRSWVELLEMKYALKLPGSRTASLRKQGDLIEFVRTDPSAQMKIEFSIPNDLNVVRSSYTRSQAGDRPTDGNRTTELHWKRIPGGPVYLSERVETRYSVNSDKVADRYTLTTREFSLVGPSRDYLSERSFLLRLPPNTLVEEDTSESRRKYLANRTTNTTPSPVVPLTKKVQSKGFLKPAK